MLGFYGWFARVHEGTLASVASMGWPVHVVSIRRHGQVSEVGKTTNDKITYATNAKQ